MKLILPLFSVLLLCGASSTHAEGNFTLSSPDIEAGGTIDSRFVYDGFGCTGKNTPPALNWSGAPEDVKSFAVTVYDPDAPTGSGWWHWVIYDLPPNSTGIAGGTPRGGVVLPKEAVQAKNDYGVSGYGGPCPPVDASPHHYVFTVYALDVETLKDLPPNPTLAMIGFQIKAHTLASATFTGMYGR